MKCTTANILTDNAVMNQTFPLLYLHFESTFTPISLIERCYMNPPPPVHATMLLPYTHIWYRNEFDQNMLPVLLLHVGNERIVQPNMLRPTRSKCPMPSLTESDI